MTTEPQAQTSGPKVSRYKARAWLTDQEFGYDRWVADMYSLGKGTHDAIIEVYGDTPLHPKPIETAERARPAEATSGGVTEAMVDAALEVLSRDPCISPDGSLCSDFVKAALEAALSHAAVTVAGGEKIIHGKNCDCKTKIACKDAEERELYGTFRGKPIANPVQPVAGAVADSQRYQWVRSRQGRGRLFETPRVSIEFSSETPKGADRAPIRAPMDAELDAAIDSQIAAERARTAVTRGGEES